MFLLGIRIRRRDVDFDTGMITIRSAVGVSEGEGLHDYTKNPKNKSSIRSFEIVKKEKCNYLVLNNYFKGIKGKQAFYAQRLLRRAKPVLCPELVLHGFFKGALRLCL